MTKIAVLGLGAMGSRMALNLVRAGLGVTVWNRDETKAEPLGRAGARVAASPRAAADGADIVISMVTDDRAGRAVWLDPETGALDGLSPSAIAVECSTVSPAWIAELGAAVSARGARLLDAPVAGSRPQAEAGQLVVMVGGAADALEAVRPALAPLAAKVIHAGGPGRGALLKLAVNAFFATQIESLAELLGMLGRTGFDRREVVELLGQFPIVAAPLAAAARMMAAGDAPPQFTVDLVEKDLGYALDAAVVAGARLPGVEAARAAFREAQTQGLGPSNITSVAAVFV